MMLKILAVTIVPVAFAVLAVACGDNAQPASTPTTVEGFPSHLASTVAAAPTPQPTSCTTSTPIQPESPADAIVNADGDGIPDRLTMFTQPGPPDANRQRPLPPSVAPESASPQPTLNLDTYTLELVLDDRAAFNIEAVSSPLVKAAPIGGYDVNGDGRDELFAVTGNGASTTYIDIFEFDPAKCALVRITNPDPHWMPPLFLVGASTGHGDGLECRDHTLISTSFRRTSNEPLRFEGTRTTYRLNGTQIETVSQTPIAFGLGTVEPAIAATFSCGSLRLPR